MESDGEPGPRMKAGEIHEHQVKVIKEIAKEKEDENKQLKFSLLSGVTSKEARQIALASEKGASSWLSSLPLEQYGFFLNKQEFQDAVALKYNFEIPGRSKRVFVVN